MPYHFSDYIKSQSEFIVSNDIPFPVDNLIYSALGARVCYSKDQPINLILNDRRVTDFETRLHYLRKLSTWHHYSVFAHSPLGELVVNEYQSNIGVLPYKSFPIRKDDGIHYILNARHSLEIVGIYINDIFNNLSKDFNVEFFVSYNDGYDIGFVKIDENTAGMYTDRDYYVVASYKPVGNYDWFFFIAHGFSRVFTHQLVRHTWLNFSQRSFRYTKTMGVGKPFSNLSDKDIMKIDIMSQVSDMFYNSLVDSGFKKQDARYIYPMGARTTIAFSGPALVFYDFVNKRDTKEAQDEIRYVAYVVRKFMEFIYGK